MIRISQIKINIEMEEKLVEKKLLSEIGKVLQINEKKIKSFQIIKKSIDARKKMDLKYSYTVDVEIDGEEKLSSQRKKPNVSLETIVKYQFYCTGKKKQKYPPLIIGSGPAGLFCAYLLAEQGYHPILLERGGCVEERIQAVSSFWMTNQLEPDCNVCFGEGGAGTFSDGKLNTLVKDPLGRNRKVLEVLVEHGAPSEILYLNKPHIGTDQLRNVVKNMREHMIALGGSVRFHQKMTDIRIENDRAIGIVVNEKEEIPCEVLVLATGHSARDTFGLLFRRNFVMRQKAFAIGLRIEHLQEDISRAQYGEKFAILPPAEYKLANSSSNGRSVYSFCMCPGGFVVNASSEENAIVVNGMSNYNRMEKNANSALVVTVSPKDFLEDSPLAGVEFQRKWESMAFQTGDGKIPVQLLGDFIQGKPSTGFGKISPNIKGSYQLANLRNCIPTYIADTIIEGMEVFERKIKGFSSEEAVLSGVETRTSSPVRILRDEGLESNKKGVYPCGEGAGYAGGIMSAAMDGIKVFEAIANQFRA